MSYAKKHARFSIKCITIRSFLVLIMASLTIHDVLCVRFATVFWYLTDVDEGGHTIFPRAGGLPPVRNHADCSRGLKVQPQKGKVIIFYSLDASGAMDPLSLHGACPVGEDNVKWAANKWLWNAPMGYVRD